MQYTSRHWCQSVDWHRVLTIQLQSYSKILLLEHRGNMSCFLEAIFLGIKSLSVSDLCMLLEYTAILALLMSLYENPDMNCVTRCANV